MQSNHLHARRRWTTASTLLAMLITTLAPAALAAPKAKHVVVIVMDGLRPDSVVEADMPNLTKMAAAGTFFTNHHPVYLSTTEVNGTALATGMRPAHSGIVGNREYRPDIELLQPVDTQSEWAVWHGDKKTGGKWISVETLPQIVRAHGGKTVVAGTKGVAMLWDRSWNNRTIDQPTLYGGDSIPAALKDQLVQSFGPIPPGTDNRYFANAAQDHWTTQALTDKLWKDGVPTLSVLWLSEPDYAQHGVGPGGKVAREALKSSDDCLGKVFAALHAANAHNETDVLVVSDHGFSTVAAGIDLMEEMYVKHGFNVGGAFLEKPEKGSIVMVGLGGSVAFYVVEHDKETLDKLVKYLQGTVFAGVIFTRDGADGTFKLSDAGIDAPEAADVIMSFRWSAEKPPREGGMPGALLIEGKSYKPGQGMHGSLSRFDMHNTLVAAGPDFKVGFKSELPSANSDVAPTVLSLLQIEPKEAMDGRVLSEAFVDHKDAESPKSETTIMKAKRDLGNNKVWQQYLKVTTVGKQRYYDEGNAGPGPEGR
jgi:arylsulfatase A-like enzyme